MASADSGAHLCTPRSRGCAEHPQARLPHHAPCLSPLQTLSCGNWKAAKFPVFARIADAEGRGRDRAWRETDRSPIPAGASGKGLCCLGRAAPYLAYRTLLSRTRERREKIAHVFRTRPVAMPPPVEARSCVKGSRVNNPRYWEKDRASETARQTQHEGCRYKEALGRNLLVVTNVGIGTLIQQIDRTDGDLDRPDRVRGLHV